MDTGKGVVRLVLPALLCGLVTTQVRAASYLPEPLPTKVGPTFGFTTEGTIGTAGLTGSPAVSFRGNEGDSFATTTTIFSNTFEASSADNIKLGDFVVAAAGGGAATYRGTPFEVAVRVTSIDGLALPGDDGRVVLRGVLDGSVSATGEPDLVARFENASDMPLYESTFFFESGDQWHLLYVPTILSLSTASAVDGQFAVLANDYIRPAPVPEPAALATFLVIAGLGLRSHLRRR